MAREEIRIPIRVDGATKARRDIESIGREGAKSAKGVKKLELGFAALGTTAAAFAGLRMADSFQLLERRIRSISSSSAEYEQSFRAVLDVSERTRTSVADNAAAFQRLTVATDELGLSSNDTAQILTTLNQAFAVGGATTSEQAAALTQLSQALASGRLQGDELRSLTENASLLAKVLGDEIGGEGIKSLRDLSRQGKLTSDVLADALLAVGNDIDAQFSALPETIGESVTKLKNSVIELARDAGPVIKRTVEGLGVFAKIAVDAATAIQTLGANESFERATIERSRALKKINPELEAYRTELEGIARQERVLAKRPGFNITAEENLRTRRDSIEGQIALRERFIADLDAKVAATKRVRDRIATGLDLEFDFSVPTPSTPRDLSADPILQAISARQQAERDMTKDHMTVLNRLAEDQFQKDIARYRAQEQTLTSVFETATDALLQYTRTGEFSFREFGSSILDTLQRILVQALVTKAVASFLGPAPTGGFSGGVPASIAASQGDALSFAGGFADGGTIPAGSFGVVGERGPELITGPANIFPMAPTGGAAPFAPAPQADSLAEMPIVNVIIEGDPKAMGIKVRTEIQEALESDHRTQRSLLTALDKKRRQTRRLLM